VKKCVVCLTIEVILLNWNSASPLSLTYSSCSSCLSLFLLLLSHVRLFWDLMNCSPLGSSVHGILQARILEWVAISFYRASSWPRNWTCVSFTGRLILYHSATWEAPCLFFFTGLRPSKWLSKSLSQHFVSLLSSLNEITCYAFADTVILF